MHRDRRKDPFRLFLVGSSLVYKAGVWLRCTAYRVGLFSARRLPAFVLSVGNLSVGGTGKTPAVEMIATWAVRKGYRPAVISRGYGGRFKGEVLVVSDGREIKSDPAQSGDEPYFLANRLSRVPVIVSKKRYTGGFTAHKELDADFLILDDGFQHWQLHRNLDVVLLDGENPFGNGYVLPRGPLREPVESIKRADAVLLTRCAGGEIRSGVQEKFSGKCSGIPVFPSAHVPSQVIFPRRDRDTALAPTEMKGKHIIGFAGIAHPDYFRESLEALGMKILSFECFEDHHVFSREEIESLLERRKKLGAHYLLMTGKDWVKVERTGVASPEMGYLDIRFKVLNGETAFFTLVDDAYQEWVAEQKQRKGMKKI